jgi:cell fate regulator YaaT (PSP1 superfamily)
LLQAEQYKAQESVALEKCNQLVAEMNIPIKAIQAEYSFDGARLLISFVSEQRVDFRDLVKELARSLKTRIEMKQVGPRDETKILDGYGRCGRRLCCSSWLTDFHPVAIRMAKLQGLPLAPAEISGMCGKLLCCLAYEDEMYAEMKKELPRVGSQVKTAEGMMATVRGLNIIKEACILEMENSDTYVEVAAIEIQVIQTDSKSRDRKGANQPVNEPKGEEENGDQPSA